MAAIAGAWRAAQIDYTGEQRWGTGNNPIHSHHDSTGRNSAPGATAAPTWPGLVEPDNYGWADEDMPASDLWGYGPATGTTEHPSYGQDSADQTHNIGYYPPWGAYEGGRPGGTNVRAVNKGADIASAIKTTMTESAAGGWVNKNTGAVEEPITSDPAAYEMRTSMRQLNTPRAGSAHSGTASEQNAPITKRIAGQRIKLFGGRDRCYDMEPRAQDLILRPFYLRTAGVGDEEAMAPNALYGPQPMTRVAPAVADSGPDVNSNAYGFTDEDLGGYF